MTKAQKCPVCDGTGLVSRPPWVAGDVNRWLSSSAGPWPCQCCVGGIVYVKEVVDEL